MATPHPLLILSDDRDPIARRARGPLEALLERPIELVSARDLEEASYFIEARAGSQVLGDSQAIQAIPCALPPGGQPIAGAGGEIVLRDGRMLFQDALFGIWNRLSRWPTRLAGSSTGARQALAAWLSGVACPLLGEPGYAMPQASDAWSRLHWVHAAAEAGLSVPDVDRQAGALLNTKTSGVPLGERAAILVAGNQTSTRGNLASELPPALHAACVRLAEGVGPLLEVRFVPQSSAGWVFAEATQNPDPFPYGPAALQHIADLYRNPRPTLPGCLPGPNFARIEGAG